jgi:hypothetical protein
MSADSLRSFIYGGVHKSYAMRGSLGRPCRLPLSAVTKGPGMPAGHQVGRSEVARRYSLCPAQLPSPYKRTALDRRVKIPSSRCHRARVVCTTQ